MRNKIVQTVLPYCTLLLLVIIAIFAPVEKNSTGWIPLTGGLVDGCQWVSGILSVVLMVMEATGDNEALAQTLRFIDRINVANAATYIGTGTTYSLTDVLYLTLPATTGTLGLLVLGLWRFNKKDLK